MVTDKEREELLLEARLLVERARALTKSCNELEFADGPKADGYEEQDLPGVHHVRPGQTRTPCIILQFPYHRIRNRRFK